ncbi:MAG TPA: hypothetical protein VH020_16575 [Stellaceae bacterium]|jgi:hypothetical protein|nr:hypothetical protein [Stellaceae bacterium]
MSQRYKLPPGGDVPIETASLFMTDDELHARIAPRLGRDRFHAALKACEERDPLFPRLDPLWRGRYWPALRAWFDNDQGVRGNAVVASSAQDGPESFNVATRRSPRPQARPASPAVLDRQPGGARPHGLPRQVHPAATGRG